MRRLLTAALLFSTLFPAPAGSSQAPRLPPRFERYLIDYVRLAPEERRRLADGAAVTRLLEADGSKEVAAFGAVWIDAPRRRYVERLNDIESFERGEAFRVTKRLSAPPRLEDFAQLRLPPQDVESLRRCRVGHCEIKLGEEALQRFHTEVDWTSPSAADAANALMRRLAFEYVTGYLEGGNERLAVYRDSEHPRFVAREFAEMIDGMPELTTYVPQLRPYLIDYPRATLPDSSSFLYWQDTAFGLKPTIRISHVTIHEGRDDTVVASKMLYASHYFWTGLELRALLSDPERGAGFWFVVVNRSRSDGLAGFTGAFVRRRVRQEVTKGTLAGLLLAKRRLEAAQSSPGAVDR
jgi:hypothetical protein